MKITGWNGNERRKEVSDHDNLTRLIVLLENHVNNFNEHRKDFEEHLEEDKKNFGILFKAYYGGVAVISLIVVLSKFIKP